MYWSIENCDTQINRSLISYQKCNSWTESFCTFLKVKISLTLGSAIFVTPENSSFYYCESPKLLKELLIYFWSFAGQTAFHKIIPTLWKGLRKMEMQLMHPARSLWIPKLLFVWIIIILYCGCKLSFELNLNLPYLYILSPFFSSF